MRGKYSQSEGGSIVGVREKYSRRGKYSRSEGKYSRSEKEL